MGTCYSFHCCDQIPDKKQPERGRLYSGSQLRGTQFIMVVKDWWCLQQGTYILEDKETKRVEQKCG